MSFLPFELPYSMCHQSQSKLYRLHENIDYPLFVDNVDNPITYIIYCKGDSTVPCDIYFHIVNYLFLLYKFYFLSKIGIMLKFCF